MPVSAPLTRVLAAGRSQFNQRVVEARRRYPVLDPLVFAEFIEKAVDPLVVAVSRNFPDRVTRLVVAAFDAALDAVGSSKSHGCMVAVTDVWRTLAPVLDRHVADDPQAVLAALGNAAITIAQHPGARGPAWLSEMLRLAPDANNWSEVRTLGQVLAWRAGLAHYRQGALAAVGSLPEALALRAVGAPDSAQWSTVRAALLADPWFVPSSAGAVAPSPAAPVWRVGEFVGFGGPFAFPPQLVAVEDGFVVVSADRTFHLIADAFGVALLPAANGEILGTPMTPVQGDLAIKGKTLIADGQRVTLDLPEGAIDVAANAHTLAVSSPCSYLIRLFPRRQPLA